MTTAGERLVALSGPGTASAGARLRTLAGVAGLAGALLVTYSGLPAGTASTHLLFDRTSVERPSITVNVSPESRDAFIYGENLLWVVVEETRESRVPHDSRITTIDLAGSVTYLVLADTREYDVSPNLYSATVAPETREVVTTKVEEPT